MKRLNIGFISFLMLLSLVCIGFSSWNIVYDQSDSVIGNIDVDEIVDGTKYISCTEFTLFDFFKTGFVNENGCISYKGTINSRFNINLDECRNSFTNSNSLEVVIDLSRTDISKFNQNNLISINHSIKYNGIDLSNVTTTINSNDYILTFDLPILDDTNSINLEIIYIFQIENNESALDYFEETLYPELMSAHKFGVTAKITGK